MHLMNAIISKDQKSFQEHSAKLVDHLKKDEQDENKEDQFASV